MHDIVYPKYASIRESKCLNCQLSWDELKEIYLKNISASGYTYTSIQYVTIGNINKYVPCLKPEEWIIKNLLE